MRSFYTIYRCSWTFYDVLHLSTRAHKVHMTLLWAFSSHRDWALSASHSTISLVIILVEGAFANCECSMDWYQVCRASTTSCSKMSINMFHCRYYSAEVWHAARKNNVACLSIYNLQNDLTSVYCKSYGSWKFNVSHRFIAVAHSSLSNLYLWRSLIDVILSMAVQQSIQKLSISKVEFHQVEMSWGIIQILRPSSLSWVFHRGRRIVEDFLIVFERAWSWSTVQ